MYEKKLEINENRENILCNLPSFFLLHEPQNSTKKIAVYLCLAQTGIYIFRAQLDTKALSSTFLKIIIIKQKLLFKKVYSIRNIL